MAKAVSARTGSWTVAATASPATVTTAIRPNSGRLEAKFFVPSSGSMMKAKSAVAMKASSDGSRPADPSPM